MRTTLVALGLVMIVAFIGCKRTNSPKATAAGRGVESQLSTIGRWAEVGGRGCQVLFSEVDLSPRDASLISVLD